MFKKDIEKKLQDCLFACQRLYNISARGLWNEVRDAGLAVLENLPEFVENHEEILKEGYSRMYAAAGYDD